LSVSFLFKNIRIEINRTIILPIVLYVRETWSLTLREEHRLRVFENRVLRRKFGPSKDEVTGELRRQHNGALYDLYSQNFIRVIQLRMIAARHVACMWERRGEERCLQDFCGEA
jgi:hypothetical protein